MSDDEWDRDNYEPPPFQTVRNTNKWEGEDDDDDVKDNWEDDDPAAEEKAAKAAEPEKKSQPAAKKKTVQIKEPSEPVNSAPKTPQEIYEEKQRRQKQQEEADLRLAIETFGISSGGEGARSIDAMEPSSKDDFENFKKSVLEKLQKYEKSPYYVVFLDDLFRDLCVGLEAEDIKKISSTLNAMCNEKVRAAKAAKSKKKGPGGSRKATLSRGNDYDDYKNIGGDADDFDDFI